MAKSDILVRWKADTANYDANMAKAKRQLEQFGQQNMTAGGVVQQLSQKLVGTAAKFASFGAAAAAAMKVAKDAFMASERSVDEWGRTIESVKGVYNGFLTAINTGDISGFLTRIDSIVSAARQAYDAIDRLGTMKTIQAPAVSAQQSENERMRMMIQTGRYIAPMDGRRASKQNGALLTADEIRALEAKLQGGMNKMVTLVGNEVKQTGKAIDAIYTSQAQQLGMTLLEFRKGTSSMAEFDKRVEGAANYRRWQEEHTTVDLQTGREIAPRYGNPYAKYKGWDVFRVDGEAYNNLVGLIQQRNQQASQAYGMQSQAYRTINRAEGTTVRDILGGGKGGGGGKTTATEIKAVTGSIDEQAKKVEDLRKAWRAAADDDSRQKIKKQIEEQEFALDIMMGKSGGIPAMTYGVGALAGRGSQDPLFKMNTYDAGNEFSSAIAHQQWRLDDDAMAAVADTIKAQHEQGKKQLDTTEKLGKTLNGVQTVLSGVEAAGFAIPKEVKEVISVIQGLMSIVQGVETVVTTFSATSQAANTTAVVALTAAVTANTAALAANSVATAIPFARGGVVRAAGGFVVPGTTYSSDQIPALLNAGEVVLNRSQVGNLASQLNDARGGAQLEAVITGEQLRLVLNNNGRRTGRGEVLTTKFY